MKNQIKSIVSGALMAAFAVTCLSANVQAKTVTPPHSNVAPSDTGKMAKKKMEKKKMAKKKMDKMSKDTASKM